MRNYRLVKCFHEYILDVVLGSRHRSVARFCVRANECLLECILVAGDSEILSSSREELRDFLLQACSGMAPFYKRNRANVLFSISRNIYLSPEM